MIGTLPLPDNTQGIIIYGSENCKYCEKAKNEISNFGRSYVYHDVNEYGGITECLNKLSHLTNNQRTIPVTFINGSYIGGYKELNQYIIHNFIIEPMEDDF